MKNIKFILALSGIALAGCTSNATMIEDDYSGPISTIVTGALSGFVDIKSEHACAAGKWKSLANPLTNVAGSIKVAVPAGQEVSFRHRWTSGIGMVQSKCDVTSSFVPQAGVDYTYWPATEGTYCVVKITEVSILDSSQPKKFSLNVLDNVVDETLSEPFYAKIHDCR